MILTIVVLVFSKAGLYSYLHKHESQITTDVLPLQNIFELFQILELY